MLDKHACHPAADLGAQGPHLLVPPHDQQQQLWKCGGTASDAPDGIGKPMAHVLWIAELWRLAAPERLPDHAPSADVHNLDGGTASPVAVLSQSG